jgi:membrane fusion protein (multidrug efflux system)
MKWQMRVAGLAAVAAGGWNISCGGAKSQAPPQLPPAMVSVIEVKPEDVPIFAEYTAQTYARDLVEVRGRVDGYIEKRLFQVGSDVKAGDVLYTLDLRPYQADVAKAKGDLEQSRANLDFAKKQVALIQAQADLAQAQANLTKAKQDVARLEPLVKEEAAPTQDLDNARAALDANQANVDSRKANLEQTRLSTRSQIDVTAAQVAANEALLRTAELNLEYATIHAPISGRIGDSLIPEGGLVSKTSATPLTTIVPLDPIWVRYKVSEGEYLAYEKRNGTGSGSNTPLELVLADNTVLPYHGKLQNAVNAVDAKTGTLELQATFPNPKHEVLPGQFGRVRFRSDERAGALLVPQRSVVDMQGQQFVLTVGPENKVVPVVVITGDRVGERWVINQGLKAGDKVIVEGVMKARPGAIVSPQPYQAPNQSKATKGA